MQKTKSNRLARGQITSSHVKQLNKLYTKGSAAFGSIANLKNASVLPSSKVVQYLQSKAPYTKYKQFRKTFPRLKAVAYSINEIWSVDVAYLDKIAQHNNGVKYLLVAVDVFIAIPTSATNEGFICKRRCRSVQKNDKAEKTRKGLDRQAIRV